MNVGDLKLNNALKHTENYLHQKPKDLLKSVGSYSNLENEIWTEVGERLRMLNGMDKSRK